MSETSRSMSLRAAAAAVFFAPFLSVMAANCYWSNGGGDIVLRAVRQHGTMLLVR